MKLVLTIVAFALSTAPRALAGTLDIATWSFHPGQTQARVSSATGAGDVDGDGFADVLVAAESWDGAHTDTGAVWLFRGANGALATTPAWQSSGPDQAFAHFGHAISAAGDVDGDGFADVLVVADRYTNGEAQEGALFVYHGSASGLALSPSFVFEGNAVGFAISSAAGAGDVNGDGFADVLVGALDPAGYGSAFLFAGSASGLVATPIWTRTGQNVGASAPGVRFGLAVAGAGDVDADGFADFLVSSESFPSPGPPDGHAWLFRGGATPSLAPAWNAGPGFGGARFGTTNALTRLGDFDGDGFADFAVGAPSFGASAAGRIFVFLGRAGSLATLSTLTIDGAGASAALGGALGPAGDVNGDGFADLVAGQPNFVDTGSGVPVGRVLVYTGTSGAPQLSQSIDGTAFGTAQIGGVGASVSGAGDVDGDGFADVVLVAPTWDGTHLDEGAAFLLRGHGELPRTSADWSREILFDAYNVGATLGPAGDLDGDGFDEFFVSAYTSVVVYRGARELPPATSPAWVLGTSAGGGACAAGDVDGDGLDDLLTFDFDHVRWHRGVASGAPLLSWTYTSPYNLAWDRGVAGLGDVNGDGYADFGVSSDFSDPEPNEGRLLVFFGSPTGPSASAAQTFETDIPAGAMQGRVSGVGDVNHDGYADVVWGGPRTTPGSVTRLYFGSPTGLRLIAWNVPGASWPIRAGDANGDGFSDVMATLGGQSVLFLGSAAGLSTTPSWGSSPVNPFASNDAGVGDLDGDALDELAVGGVFPPGPFVRTARMWRGAQPAPALAASWERPQGNVDDIEYGSVWGGFGDVNGDGVGDVMLGAPNTYNDDYDSRVYLFLGNRAGPPLRVQQWRADDGTRLGRAALSDALDGFRIHVRPSGPRGFAGTPAGRVRARLVWEVKALGQPLDGSALARGMRLDTGAVAGSPLLDELVTGLAPSTCYRWRARIDSGDPLISASRWLSPANNGTNEHELRTANDCNQNGVADQRDIALGASLDADGNRVPDECQVPGQSFCFGDGLDPQVTTDCPCANFGGPGRGCAHASNALGAELTATGSTAAHPVTGTDTVVLTASGMPSTTTSIFLKADAVTPEGLVFGDGVRCADGNLIRMSIKIASGGVTRFPEAGNASLSVRGQTPIGSGLTGTYQTYYRAAAAAFCPPATFNVTQAWSITW